MKVLTVSPTSMRRWAPKSPFSAFNVTALRLFGGKKRRKDDRNGMRGLRQDEVAVLILFLCTSSSVSHYCVQTRADVYSAETSKSPAPGCNLVTSFSLLLPALLASRPLFPAVKIRCPIGWWVVGGGGRGAKCITSIRAGFFIQILKLMISESIVCLAAVVVLIFQEITA